MIGGYYYNLHSTVKRSWNRNGSPVAEGWINYVGTTEATFTPTPLGMVF